MGLLVGGVIGAAGLVLSLGDKKSRHAIENMSDKIKNHMDVTSAL